MKHGINLLFLLLPAFALIFLMSACSLKRRPKMPPLASIEGINAHFGRGRIVDLREGKSISFDGLMDRMGAKDLIFVGEVHDNPEHHLIEVQILQGLMARYGPVAVAMEFVDHTRQGVLDRYLAEKVSETDFLKDLGWNGEWSFPYHFYRPIILLSRQGSRALLGINAPDRIVKKVARSGLKSLDPGERALVAKEIDLGNQAHREYLRQVFEGHSEHHQLKNFEYFYEAQCVWEETMAENIARYLADKGGKMVVFTGSGHIRERFGIPERVLRRLRVKSATILLLALTERTVLNRKMADYVWLTSNSRGEGFMKQPEN
ncbi:MAG: ChaN family lipoprotein [Deltaproteobacteria bacterium]|nr:ChaN family lipoprotein [Deltaproteobacteria bacterium]